MTFNGNEAKVVNAMNRLTADSTNGRTYHKSKDIATISGLTRSEVFAALIALADAGAIKSEHVRREHSGGYDFLYALTNI